MTIRSLLLLFILYTIVYTQPTPSQSCQIYNLTTNTCFGCVDGFYLVYFFCLPCAPLCHCENAQNFCLYCLSVSFGNYNVSAYYNATSLKCQLCYEVMPNCLSCQTSITCTSCFGGYYINGSQCSTVLCISNCEICSSSNTCSLCVLGYTLDTTNTTCIQSNTTVANCLEINVTNQLCVVCNVTYYVQSSNNTCQPCLQYCLICQGPSDCESCIPSYGFQQGSCQNTGLSNCIFYSDDFSLCLVCQPGYYNLQGSCNQCSGCDLCTTGFICLTECQPGYTAFNYNCLADDFRIWSTSIILLLLIPSIFLLL